MKHEITSSLIPGSEVLITLSHMKNKHGHSIICLRFWSHCKLSFALIIWTFNDSVQLQQFLSCNRSCSAFCSAQDSKLAWQPHHEQGGARLSGACSINHEHSLLLCWSLLQRPNCWHTPCTKWGSSRQCPMSTPQTLTAIKYSTLCSVC